MRAGRPHVRTRDFIPVAMDQPVQGRHAGLGGERGVLHREVTSRTRQRPRIARRYADTLVRGRAHNWLRECLVPRNLRVPFEGRGTLYTAIRRQVIDLSNNGSTASVLPDRDVRHSFFFSIRCASFSRRLSQSPFSVALGSTCLSMSSHRTLTSLVAPNVWMPTRGHRVSFAPRSRVGR
jgi:hypothetical protein